jgi:hypothetical protein
VKSEVNRAKRAEAGGCFGIPAHHTMTRKIDASIGTAVV